MCQKLKLLWHFEVFVNTGPYGAENFKTLLVLQFSSDVKLYEDIGRHSGIQAITFLGKRPIFINFVALSNFNMGTNGKTKMWIIPKKDNRRVKQTKIWDSGSNIAVPLMPDSLSWVWGHSAHFKKFLILRLSKRYLSNNFHWIPSKLYENIACHGGMQAITLLGNRPSFTKFNHTLKF